MALMPELIPKDNFVMAAYTRANLVANQKYTLTVRADDGYRLWAHKLNGGAFDITAGALSGVWQQDAYGYKTMEFTAPDSGTFDLHFQMFEQGGNAYFDLSWGETAPQLPSLHPNPTSSNPLIGFTHPLQGEGSISQGNGGSTSHTGRSQYAYDYAVPIGTPVYSMRPGTVVKMRDIHPDTGGGISNQNQFNYVLIDHGNGYRSAYLHLQQGFRSRINISVGSTVQAGQLIGYSGNSGWSTGPHLHVEVHRPTPEGYFGKTVPFRIG
ncbi:MAG: M23 family metallopeptidase [Synechococcales cyanobacterium RM1_1_8]|nr:M23 family metallopeptidase [Synechococcales cyanobacterium RM1_1_8]